MKKIDVVLTAMTPISHHDAAQANDSNSLVFNRQKQLIKIDTLDQFDNFQMGKLLEMNKIPASIKNIFDGIDFYEYAAVCIVKQLIEMYSTKDGEGLFVGMDRYNMLEGRLQNAATRCGTLFQFWSVIADTLKLPIHSKRFDDSVALFFTMPRYIQRSVLRSMMMESRSIITIARVWVNIEKSAADTPENQKSLFAEENIEFVTPVYKLEPQNQTSVVLEVPVISTNGLRHQIRYAGWLHLVDRLGIAGDLPGKGQLLPSVEALFVNGGNIAAGSKQPSDTFAIKVAIRETFPILDLMGGTVDSFDLGESKLALSSFICCKENAAITKNFAPSDTSIFEMLDNVTLTRTATEAGKGQMIYNFETLCSGTQVLIRYTLRDNTRSITESAFAAAYNKFREFSTIGGKSAAGFGYVLSDTPELDASEYESYLEQNKDALKAYLLDGTLGTGKSVLL